MKTENFDLLRQLCSIHAPSGNESAMTSFLIEHITQECKSWKTIPEVHQGENFQNCIVLIFGNPKTAVYAHIDSIGFTARYDNELVKIGYPKCADGYILKGADSGGSFTCSLSSDPEEGLIAQLDRIIDPGTDLIFEMNFRETPDSIQSCYLDNRLGVFVALKLAETMENGAIVFSCWEEHGGGTAGYLAGWLYSRYNIRQSLICDITWATTGVLPGKGVAVSMRDSGIPRKKFTDRVRSVLDRAGVPYQVEVESSGGSDGNEIQKAPYPIDWCFVGAPEEMVHSPDEKVHKSDIESMIQAYRVLIENL